jgi:FtsP/CotA-like multicopper oxidase with cupredoxin domain
MQQEFNKINNVEFQNPLYYPLTASSKKIFTPQINNISMMMPSSPLLYQWNDIPKGLICNQTNKNTVCPPNQSDYCSCIHVLEINLNELVELVIVDEGFTYQSNHPMHLHGYEFAVIGIEKVVVELLFVIFLLNFYIFKS